MFRPVCLPILGLAAAFGSTAAASQTTGCANAATTVEKLICTDRQLAALNASLAALLKARLEKEPAHRRALLTAQSRWLQIRDRTCTPAAATAPARAEVACLAAAYRKRMAALRPRSPSPPPFLAVALCNAAIAGYRNSVQADPEAASPNGFYAASPLAVAASNAQSGITIAPHVAQKDKDPQPLEWLRLQKPTSYPKPLLEAIATSDFVDRLPGTDFYVASRIEGTAQCYSSTYFEVKGSAITPARGPRNWDGAGCGTSRSFGKIGGTQVAYAEAYDNSPSLTSNLMVTAWRDGGFGPSCSIHFAFTPRFSAIGDYNDWKQSCHAGNCDELRGAALDLVTTVQGGPAGVEKDLIDKLTDSQRSAYLAMKTAGQFVDPQKAPTDPAALSDTSPLILPLVAGGQVYLAQIGHFTVGWRAFSDWSVKIDQLDGPKLKRIAHFAIGMTKGALVKADAK